MNLDYFAGAIFTPQEVSLFSVTAFVIAGTLAGISIFFGQKLYNKVTTRNSKGRKKLFTAMLLGYGLVGAIILLFFVLPTIVKDSNWENKQQSCAKKVGYSSPAEDNSNSATSKSQSAYRLCLNR